VSGVSRNSTVRLKEAVKKIRGFNAEIAEPAEKSRDFFSAVSAVSAFNVICSHALKADATYETTNGDRV
jgi:hypothetical protein